MPWTKKIPKKPFHSSKMSKNRAMNNKPSRSTKMSLNPSPKESLLLEKETKKKPLNTFMPLPLMPEMPWKKPPKKPKKNKKNRKDSTESNKESKMKATLKLQLEKLTLSSMPPMPPSIKKISWEPTNSLKNSTPKVTEKCNKFNKTSSKLYKTKMKTPPKN